VTEFRWDIQGLRAIAVLVVVWFHINPELLPGGYIGVDVFFVISGYLIIGFIHRDLKAGTFQLKTFYLKRAFRLFPALFAMVAASAVAAYAVLLPDELVRFFDSMVATLFYYSNFYFYAQADYFNTAMKFAPLLHTWSLSVEEQFYLVFPWLLIWAVWKKWRTGVMLLAVGSASFLLSLLFLDIDPAFAFFASPTRFFQFIAGGLVAVLWGNARLRPLWADMAVLAGLVMIVFSAVRFDETTPFPGLYALVPTAGAALIVWAGGHMRVLKWSLVNPLFSFIGNASYSIYLWHWPLIVFYKLKYSPNLSSAEQVALFAGTLVLGALSWQFIEQKTRLKRVDRPTLRPVAAMMAGSALFSLGVWGIYRFLPPSHLEYRHKAYQYLNHVAEGMRAGECFLTSKYNDFKFYQKEKCVTYEEGKKNYLLLGDSHAAHYYRAMAEMLEENETLTQVTSSGCPPVMPFSGGKQCRDLHSWAFNTLIKEKHFNTIVISANWFYAAINNMKGIRETLAYLTHYTNRVVVLGPSMQYAQSLPRLLVELPEGMESTQIYKKAGRYKLFKKLDKQMRQMLRMKGVIYISTFEALCDEKGCTTVTPEGVPVNFDEGHLTYEGAKYILKKIGSVVFDRNISEAK